MSKSTNNIELNAVEKEIEKPYIATIDVFTDGSLKKTKRGDICGYGIYFPGRELNNVGAPFTYGNITNNRAELFAILQTIIRIKNAYRFGLINIFTDSEYSQKSLTEWIVGWKKNGWKNAKKKPVENQDIIMKIDSYLERFKGKINIQWVRAHTGKNDKNSINNAKADALANIGAEEYAKRVLKHS
jgi:ribonuclease HI